MLPDLGAVGFAATLKPTLPFPLPEGVVVKAIHGVLLVAVHPQPAAVVTLTVPEEAAPPNVELLSATENVQAGAEVTARLNADVY